MNQLQHLQIAQSFVPQYVDFDSLPPEVLRMIIFWIQDPETYMKLFSIPRLRKYAQDCIAFYREPDSDEKEIRPTYLSSMLPECQRLVGVMQLEMMISFEKSALRQKVVIYEESMVSFSLLMMKFTEEAERIPSINTFAAKPLLRKNGITFVIYTHPEIIALDDLVIDMED